MLMPNDRSMALPRGPLPSQWYLRTILAAALAALAFCSPVAAAPQGTLPNSVPPANDGALTVIGDAWAADQLDTTGADHLSAPDLDVTPYVTVVDNGPSSNRVDLVVLGDGYREPEIGTTYTSHVLGLIDYMFHQTQEPFARYKSFFNVHQVNIVSNESGADAPPLDIYRDTALDASYWWGGGVERLLYVNTSKASSALSAGLAGAGFYAEVRVVTVNDSRYGGGGGSYAVYAGANSSSKELALHEMGHSFGDLADEYAYTTATWSGGEPRRPNVTASPTGDKWAAWLGYVDPDHPEMGPIGAYEGASNYAFGLYRPSQNSKMRSLNRPFDAVGREQFILRMYDYVDPLDDWFTGPLVDPPSLWVDTVDPALVDVDWYVDGTRVAADGGEVFRLQDHGFGPGTYDVEARAFDGSGWVRMDLEHTTQSKQWSVTLTQSLALTWDGTSPGRWTGAHWNPGPVAPGGGETMVVNSGLATVSSDLTATPAASLTIAGGAAGGTVDIGASGVLRVTGEVNVGTGGTLSIDGALVAPVVNVAGGTLTSSTGRAGTASVQGNIVLTGGATFAIDATDTGLDRLTCTGSVTIDPSASLAIAPPASGGPAIGFTAPLITADGGLDGIFGRVDGVLYGVERAFAVTYQPNGATVTVTWPGDFEVDGDVDFGDFTDLAANYGQAGKSWVDGDCDGNGTVEFVDFTYLTAYYGSDIDSFPAGDSDSLPAGAANAPPAGTVELHVDVVSGEMWLVGNAATLSGYNITSAAGSLVPDGDGAAAPFQSYLSNLAGDITAASLGAGVLIDGDLALDAAYDTAGPMDLAFSYGVYGQGGSLDGSVVVVPEPAALSLLALGALAMLRRKRRG